MMTTPERRHSERARIPCHIPVELSDTKRECAFDADAVDLSVGGLSLRAARVPELGSLLFCSFEAMPGGATVLGRGEVVWRQAGERGGEFGLRFVEVDAKHQAMIDEMVAERIARIETPFTQPTPVIANLEIENVDKPVAARLVHNGETEAVFEQALDLLSLGKGVIAHAGVSLLRGNISQVALRMEGTTPLLSIKLQLQRDPARFGEFQWGEPGSDTDPDVFAHGHPGKADEDAHEDEAEDAAEDEAHKAEAPAAALGDESAPSATLAGIGSPLPAPIVAREEESAKQLPLVFKREAAETAPEVAPLRLTLQEFPEEPDRVYADEEHARALLEATSLEHVKSLAEAALEEAGENVAGSEEEDEVPPSAEEAPHPSLVSALRVFAAAGELGERAKETLTGLGAKLRIRTGAQRVVGSRSRKVTAVSSRLQNEDGLPKLSKVMLCVFFVGAAGLLAFVFMPAPRAPLPDPLETDVRAASDDAQLVSANPAAQLGGPTPEADSPTGAAPAAGSAYAVDARAHKPAAAPSPKLTAAAPSVSVFGHAQVPNGKRYLLRMQNPVGQLQGVADSDGFSVILPANKALEKAAPIKAGIPSVASAAIVNFKDHAELRVHFVPGKKPMYRISGQGTNLEVLIAP